MAINELSVIIPIRAATGEPGEEHSPEIQEIIECLSDLGYDFVDYGLEQTSPGLWVGGEVGELCFSSSQ